MAWNPVETVDYIFNRYAFLNLQPDASLKAIRTAIKQKRLENHPDRLVKVGEEVRRLAERLLEKLADCEAVLLNADKKAHFDERLVWFKANRPLAICKDGRPLIALDGPHFNVPVLLGQSDPETAINVLDQAKVLSRANPEQTAKLRKLYKLNPDDADIRDMLADALRAELMYFDAVEEDAWQQAGVANKKDKVKGFLYDPLDYVERAQQEIVRTMEEDIPQQFAHVLGVAQIGMASPLLLLAPPSVEGGDSVQHALPARLEDVRVEDLVQQARLAMEKKQGLIEDAARQKQAILKELADLTELVWLTPLPPRLGNFTILLMMARQDDEPVAVIAVQGHDEQHNLQGLESHPGLGMTLTELMALAYDHDTIAIGMDPEVGQPLLSIVPAVEKRRRELGLKPIHA